jgi:hypothetical protein
VGSSSAPTAAAPARSAGDGAAGIQDQDEARTFFVAMVARATITTSRSSFFMVASVAAAQRT